MNKKCTWIKSRIIGWSFLSLAMVLSAARVSVAGPRNSDVPPIGTKIYTSGVVTLGPDESLQLTIVNNSNVSDPVLPRVPASEAFCTFVARFLDGNGNTLQQQQGTLQPGQNFSLSVSGHQMVQAWVDVIPGNSFRRFAVAIAANQCVVSSEVLNSSNSPVLFPPLVNNLTGDACYECEQETGCYDCPPRTCSGICEPIKCLYCRDACKKQCLDPHPDCPK